MTSSPGGAARLSTLVDAALDGNWAELKRRAGISPGSIDAYRHGRSLPSWEQIIRICDSTNANPTWLLTGEGPMLRVGAAGDEQADGGVRILEMSVHVSAGDGEWVLEEVPKGHFILDEVYFRREIGLELNECRIVRVAGDSMEPTFRSGDPVMVYMAAPQPWVDGIWVIRQGNGVLVKRLQFLAEGTVRVISDNKDYREQLLDLTEEQPDFHLVGRVVWSPRLH